MHIDEAVTHTQDRLAREGETMDELLGRFRNRVSPVLIGDGQWQRILDCARRLPITMGSLPFGFELPLHLRDPQADFGTSLASGTRPAAFFEARAREHTADETAGTVTRLFGEMEADGSDLRAIVGRKLMLEYDIGSARDGAQALPGMFLRPGERPIIGAGGQAEDVVLVADTLMRCAGWGETGPQCRNARRAYLAQPEDTRMDSFGIFPARSRALRLAVMGFRSHRQVCAYLQGIGWPGRCPAVTDVIERFEKRVKVVRVGVNINAEAEGIGPELGLTLVVKQRYTKDSRYWLDGLTDWEPFLEAMRHEEIIMPEKLAALAGWVCKPTPLFAKSGQYVLLRGIHHIKLVMDGEQLRKAKAYVFMVLSGAVSFQ